MNPQPTHHELIIAQATTHLGKPELIAAKVQEHGEEMKHARLAYEAIAGEHYHQLIIDGIVGLPEKEAFSKAVARKLLNLHAAVLLKRRIK